MSPVPEQMRRKILDEERLGCFLEMQQRLEQDGKIPPGPRLLLRIYEHPLQWVGGILIGLIVASGSILFDFVLFNVFLHFF